jgi:hypothetical protein
MGDFDIIFSTYNTVTTEFARGIGRLYSIRWFRIVLDEGITLCSHNLIGSEKYRKYADSLDSQPSGYGIKVRNNTELLPHYRLLSAGP